MILQNNPLANYAVLRGEIDEAIGRVLRSGQYILGEETRAFEREFAAYVGARYAVGVASGTDALHLSLRALGIGPGDEVLTVSHTALATVAAIEMAGALPVFVDVDPVTYTLDPGEVQNRLTERTRAILPVHLYGQPAELEPLIQCARSRRLHVIEDCAQAHGARYRGAKVGAWGDAGAFSFYPTKNLGALGDGGAVTTCSEEIYRRLLSLRQYGWDEQRLSQTGGCNSRLDELQSAVLRVKLRRLDENNARRRRVADQYSDRLQSLPITLPLSGLHSRHVYHQYVIRCGSRETRDALQTFLWQRGVGTAVHYPLPVHLQPYHAEAAGGACSLPVTEELCQAILSLPMFPELTEEDANAVAAAVSDFFRGGG